MRREHSNYPSCPFCLIGFYNQLALNQHIENYHSENTQIVREKRQVKRGICIFFLQPRGCKKGPDCDFTHQRGGQFRSIKVRKLCCDGPQCSWKPRCRYVHPEDGEPIPPWVSRTDRVHRGGQPPQGGYQTIQGGG